MITIKKRTTIKFIGIMLICVLSLLFVGGRFPSKTIYKKNVVNAYIGWDVDLTDD